MKNSPKKPYINKVILLCYTLILPLLGSGCAGTTKDYSEYSLSQQEIEQAKMEFEQGNGTILLQLFLDRQGSVLDVEVLAWDKKQTNLHTSKRFARKMKSVRKYTPALLNDPSVRVITEVLRVQNEVD